MPSTTFFDGLPAGREGQAAAAGGLALVDRPVSGASAAPSSDGELFMQFESLGDNCEFGIAQRYAGVEPLGLFRFNFTQIDALIAGLDCRFADLAEEGQVDPRWEHGQWMIHELRYKFCYHTFNRDRSYDMVRLRREQTRWLKRMAEKFLEQLAIGDRIYVRKGEPAGRADKIQQLVHALRRIGPATLLWVRPENAACPSGTVTIAGDGLLHGYIRSFARYDSVPDLDPKPWRHLLQRSWALHHLGDADAFPSRPKTNLITTGTGWRPSPAASTELVLKQDAERRETVAFLHRLHADAVEWTPIFGWINRHDLAPGEPCVASAEIWLPPDFTGQVRLLMSGQPTLQRNQADHKIRERWRTVFVCARPAEDNLVAYPRLHIKAPAGATFFSTNWRLEIGHMPG